MLAIDTNVIVRFLIDDDADQAFRARKILLTQDVFVPTTVILETAWVLSKGYGYTHAQLVDGLRAISGLPRLTLEEPDVVAEATDRLEQGLDFADALHLAKSKHCQALLTFDKTFVRRANKLGGGKVQMA